MGLCELVGVGIALACEPVDDRASRIAESHDLGALVDGFACSIVDGLSEHLHVVVCVYAYNLRVSSADKQAEEWEWRCGTVVV